VYSQAKSTRGAEHRRVAGDQGRHRGRRAGKQRGRKTRRQGPLRLRRSEQAACQPRRDAPARRCDAWTNTHPAEWMKSRASRKRPRPRPAASPRRSRRGLPSRSRHCSNPPIASIADRLNQEALLIAAKADIREELDRIASHITQTREMLGKGGPVGRRLDFLAQEFNREVNTCCSKSNDLELTKYRPRNEDGGRTIPRAGPESGVTYDGWRRRFSKGLSGAD